MNIRSALKCMIGIVLVCGGSVVVKSDEFSLCKPNEKILFSCLLENQKTVSLCGDSHLSKDAGYLQYRYGKDASSIELEYPSVATKPAEVFKFYSEGWPKGSVVVASFIISKYRYSLFDTASVYGFNGSGLIVKKSGRQVSYLPCKRPLSLQDGRMFYSLLENMGFSGKADDVDYIGPEQ